MFESSGSIIDDRFVNRIWRYGKPAPIWLRHLDLIKKTIRDMRLKPLTEEHFSPVNFSTVALSMPRTTAKTAKPIIIKDIYGGIRVPHLHLGDKVYMMSDKQWGAFSSKVVREFQAKLASTNAIRFEDVMDLSETIDAM